MNQLKMFVYLNNIFNGGVPQYPVVTPFNPISREGGGGGGREADLSIEIY